MRTSARRTVSAAVALGAVGVIGLVGAGAAGAYPSSCTLTKTSTSVSVRCTGGTGGDRAWVKCYDPLRDSYFGTTYGPWVGLGATSTIRCPFTGNVQTTVTSGHFGFQIH
jgi:hypothetical protein